jgi:hypothetical protein
MWAFAEFVSTLTAPLQVSERRLDALLAKIQAVSAREDFNDDFSMVELLFS